VCGPSLGRGLTRCPLDAPGTTVTRTKVLMNVQWPAESTRAACVLMGDLDLLNG
jgi:hypothetical protein